jgi:hypothetical protein
MGGIINYVLVRAPTVTDALAPCREEKVPAFAFVLPGATYGLTIGENVPYRAALDLAEPSCSPSTSGMDVRGNASRPRSARGIGAPHRGCAEAARAERTAAGRLSRCVSGAAFPFGGVQLSLTQRPTRKTLTTSSIVLPPHGYLPRTDRPGQIGFRKSQVLGSLEFSYLFFRAALELS